MKTKTLSPQSLLRRSLERWENEGGRIAAQASDGPMLASRKDYAIRQRQHIKTSIRFRLVSLGVSRRASDAILGSGVLGCGGKTGSASGSSMGTRRQTPDAEFPHEVKVSGPLLVMTAFGHFVYLLVSPADGRAAVLDSRSEHER